MNSGVNRKISAQVRYLSKYGIDSTIYPIIKTRAPTHLTDNRNRLLQIPGIKEFSSTFEKIYREYQCNKTLEVLISSLFSDDFIYLRTPYPSPHLSIILQKKRKCKIIIEYQDIEPNEYRSKGKYWYLLIDSLFGDALRRYTDAIVGVTEEITQYELKRSGETDKPHITIGNGIDSKSVPVRNFRENNNSQLHLICVANVSRWHGLDRLLNGMAIYRGNSHIFLHIAGEGADIPSLKQLVEKLNLQNHVIFHGFITGIDLDILFNSCHIAVGSLGIHRKG
jgi:glycosyltransferase involved in cell wall biosynthesis